MVAFSLVTTWAALAMLAAQEPTGPAIQKLSNQAYELTATANGDQVNILLYDKIMGLTVADGQSICRANAQSADPNAQPDRLTNAKLELKDGRLIIHGRLAGLDLEQTFTARPDHPFIEEKIVLTNNTAATIRLAGLEIGLRHPLTDGTGKISPELASDRWIAVPFRVRATDPPAYANDFSVADLLSQPGYEPQMDGNQRYLQNPSPHRRSEGWAWTHADHTLGIFAFCQEHMVFSTLTAHQDPGGGYLRFGGACMISGQPDALTRIDPGQSVDLGLTRYQTVRGGYREAMYAYRAMLDEHGCRFPKDYNPPVHWEQLYDMPDAWLDRPHRYTRQIVEQEAVKGRDYSCEALYLDPGWDTDFGSFLWGEQWLGPRKEFIADMQSKYALKLALHCPLATWISHPSTWSPTAANAWPKETARTIPSKLIVEATKDLRVPAHRDGRRNLALVPPARAEASSLLPNYAIHQVPHLNDGWYGNQASWVAGQMPAWAQIDLGQTCRIGEVRLTNDRTHKYADRIVTHLRILVATEYTPDSDAPSWHSVAEYRGQDFTPELSFPFPPVSARWVRVQLLESKELPRLDEIEVYAADPPTPEQAADFEKIASRGPNPYPPPGARLCLGSKQYLDEAEKRLLDQCAAGAIFLMFDGNWWNDGCDNPDHGHPVPYLMEDHIRANLDLVRRVHAKYPNVLIELHDPIAGGAWARYVPVYYKYGLPGSYDDNWGFELMWNSMSDLREGRARSLYYYNLGCNVPLYLHINLRGDNRECVVLWWYASTCRHLGIGGTHADPAVVAAEKEAMKLYRKLDRFYKRGEFLGLGEDIHLHVLPKENAFVVNLFNLTDKPRTVAGIADLKELGLDSVHDYAGSAEWAAVKQGRLQISLELPPWSARVAEFH